MKLTLVLAELDYCTVRLLDPRVLRSPGSRPSSPVACNKTYFSVGFVASCLRHDFAYTS